jgi:hypothetical protein
MLLTVKEMEVLCIFHAGSRSATIDALRGAMTTPNQTHPRFADIETLLEKLSRMKEGDAVYLDFEVAE